MLFCGVEEEVILTQNGAHIDRHNAALEWLARSPGQKGGYTYPKKDSGPIIPIRI